MNEKSYNKALEDLRDELAPKMYSEGSSFDYYPKHVVSWTDIEKKIEELKKPDNS